MLETVRAWIRPGDSRQLADRVGTLLSEIGVQLNGDRPQDIQVHDPRFYRRVLAEGSVGLGESYMDGWWDCRNLDQLIHDLLSSDMDRRVRSHFDAWDYLKARLVNLQKGRRSFRVGEHHYDLGNDFYRRMLDHRMVYSCGYWDTDQPAEVEASGEGLNRAQERKLDLVARKLYLEPGMKVLDIGCGWGGTAAYLAEQYDVEVTGITISRAQAEWAEAHCQGLPVMIRLEDYRDTARHLAGQFDRIVSIGMFEHVGFKNYAVYMDAARRLMTPNGLFLLHTIAGNRRQVRTDPWIARYIFPNSMAPYIGNLGDAMAGRFVAEDWQNIGTHYDPTLRSWHQNVQAHAATLAEADSHFDERFFRMWRYYLLSCAGAFRARRNQVWQIVLSPNGYSGAYRRPDDP